MAAATYYNQVQEIYVAYYGRPADPAGLQYWAGKLDAIGGNLTTIIKAFGDSTESTALYAGASNSAIVTAIYQQLFNRAPDSAGLAFYTGELTAGRMTGSSIALNVADGAVSTDATYLANKITVANAFTDALTVDPSAALAYDGTTAITAARSLITGVTTSAATTNVASTITSIKSGGGSTAGETFTLTTDEDTFNGTSGNDTFTAAAGTLDGEDRIVDSSTSDKDVLNITASGDPDPFDVTNVETININWTGFGTPDINLDNTTGATVVLTSTRSGYLGDANFDNVGDNNVSVGAGVKGTVTIDAIEDATVTAAVAEEILITNADGAITVNAGAASTVDVEGGDDVVITALSADTIEVTGTQDTTTLTIGADVELLVDSGESVVSIESDDDVTVTLDAESDLAELEATGDGKIDIVFGAANTGEAIDGVVVSTLGSVTIDADVEGDLDLSGIDASGIVITGAFGAPSELTLATGANVTLEVDLADEGTFVMNGEDDGTDDSVTLTTEASQTSDLIFTDFETVTIINGGDAEDAEGITLSSVDVTDAEGNGTLVLESDGEAALTITSVAASEIDATEVTTELTLTQAEDADLTVVAGSGGTTVEFIATTAEVTFVAEGGDNTVNGDTVTSGTLAVITGDGDDSVSIDDIAAEGQVSLELGNGDNEFEIKAGIAANSEVSVTMGDGDDTLTITGDADAEGTLVVDMGDGENTLDLSGGADVSAGTDISGVTVIDIGSAGDDAEGEGFDAEDVTAIVNGDLLDGQSIEILANGLSAEDQLDSMLGVVVDAEGAYDFSKLQLSGGIDDAVGGLYISFTDAEDIDLRGSVGGDYIDAEGGDVTIKVLAGDSVASSEVTIADAEGVIAEGDTLIFARGVDAIENFAFEGDFIDFVNGDGETLAVSAIEADAEDLDEDTIFFLSGDWDAEAMEFTIKEDGTGTSTIVFENQDTAAMDVLSTATNIVLLVGVVSDDLTAEMFV